MPKLPNSKLFNDFVIFYTSKHSSKIFLARLMIWVISHDTSNTVKIIRMHVYNATNIYYYSTYPWKLKDYKYGEKSIWKQLNDTVKVLTNDIIVIKQCLQ